MSLKAALASHIKADGSVSLRVGSRVYLTVAPQNAVLPYITIQQISGEHIRHMTAESGLARMDVQISCFDDSPVDVDTLADELRLSLSHIPATTIGTPPNTAAISRAFLDTSNDDYAPGRDAKGSGIYGVRMSWTVWYAETVPTFV